MLLSGDRIIATRKTTLPVSSTTFYTSRAFFYVMCTALMWANMNKVKM